VGEIDARGARLLLDVEARQMDGDNGQLRLPGGEKEGIGELGVRLFGVDSVTEARAGAIARNLGTLPRASFVHERTALRDHLAVGVSAQASGTVEDTPFSRVASVRHQGLLTAHGEQQWLYADIELGAALDTTAQAEYLGRQLSFTGEAGARLGREHPEWEVGFQGIVTGRSNVEQLDLPLSIRPLLARRPHIHTLLPASYKAITAVTRLTRGDLSERSRLEAGAFPRYECEVSAGVAFPAKKPLANVYCKLALRVRHQGWVSAVARYEHGFAGIANGDLFTATLTYTQPL
jgi:hypothetical protein